MAAWSRATSLCTGSARVRGVCRGSAALRSTIECAISPTCSNAICSRSSRSAAWCPESSSWLCGLRMEACAARPFHRRQPGGVRALSAAHALHRGLLRRHARWSCWLVDVAVPVLRVAGDRFRPATGFQLPRAQAGRRRTADPRPATPGRQGGTEGSYPARPVLPALDRELDSLCIAIPVSDVADGRQSVPSDGRDVGRIEKRLSPRRRSERATMDRRFCDGDAQRRPAYVVRRLRRVRQSLSGAGLTFPLIAKPDVGHNRLCRIDDALALREYLRPLPCRRKAHPPAVL